MTLLSLINLWSISTSHCGLTYHPFGPSQPSFGLKMAQMVQPRTQPSLMLSSMNQFTQFPPSYLLNYKEVTL
ncbi:hypothetical protein NC652_014765 [Populus alba x Populus x berolinensis]|nr:hypothetical protein NC652_014765 [Populus alba x Populus x berolinensis]